MIIQKYIFSKKKKEVNPALNAFLRKKKIKEDARSK